MESSNPTVVLTLIMKDEAEVIAHCLNSALPFVDAVVIVDTGSTDASIEIAEHVLKYTRGAIARMPWKGFADSRNDALELAKDFGDYALMIDADCEFVAEEDSNPQTLRDQLVGPAHQLAIRQGAVSYLRPAISRRDSGGRYRGVLHEWIQFPEGTPYPTVISGFHIANNVGRSARNKNPHKYFDDAAVFLRALESCEPELVPRYTFYLGQSYRDAGALGLALEAYERRISLGGWPDEVYFSQFMRAEIKAQIGRPREEIVSAYLEAHETNPRRGEALHGLARYARGIQAWNLAFMASSRGVSLVEPAGALFSNSSVYRTGLKFELSICSWYVGEFELGERLCVELLASNELNEADSSATVSNLALYRNRSSLEATA